MDKGHVKAFLYAWLGKQRRFPHYTVTPMQTKKCLLFKCQLRVDGYNHTSHGEATSKKDAQTNAAIEFCSFLVEKGFMSARDAPFIVPYPNQAKAKKESSFDTKLAALTSRPPPGWTGNAAAAASYHGNQQNGPVLAPPIRHDPPSVASNTAAILTPFKLEPSAKPMEPKAGQVDSGDLNAKIHGSWTFENAKSRLSQFLQMNNINASYVFSDLGSNQGYFAQMTIFVQKLNKELHAREHGENKVLASKACALNLVRQLFHHGLIEEFNGVLDHKEPPQTPLFSVKLSQSCIEQLATVCQSFDLKPGSTLKAAASSKSKTSLVPEMAECRFKSTQPVPSNPMHWCPPVSNWDPWHGAPIAKESKFAGLSLKKVNVELAEEYETMRTKDPCYAQKRSVIDQQLPVIEYKQALLDEIGRNQVVLVRGTTGCGKTTQIPQLILDSYLAAGKGSECAIVVTQPRRLSAVSLADRVANERCEPLGKSCGYSVRFENRLPRPYGSILFCSVGVLLRRLENGLRGISHIIVDEIHERDLLTDFLLVLLRDMTRANKNMRVILMSATLDTSMFSQYFDNCPVVQIVGQAHPVQEYFLEDVVEMLDFVQPMSSRSTRKRKLKELETREENSNSSSSTEEDEEDDDAEEGAITSPVDVNCNEMVAEDQFSEKTRNAMKSLSERAISFELIAALMSFITDSASQKQPAGSVLIFLPSCQLINALIRFLVKNTKFGNSNRFLILPLHSQLSRHDQHKVFAPAPPAKCKIIVSTDIAQSSLTIDDVVFVIDTCRVQQKMVSTRNNLTSYATVYASKSSCEQRKGRAGRVRAGHYFCLVSKARYQRLDEHQVPEILRAPLLEIELAVKLLQLGDVREFLGRAVQAPPLHSVAEAEASLKAMNALDANGELTPLGKVLARLPLEPRIGKILVLGCLLNVGDSICTIAAATSSPDMFSAASAKNCWSNSRSSDHVAILKAFGEWREFKQSQGAAANKNNETAEHEFCERKGLDMRSLRMTNEARHQLKSILIASGFPEECFTENNEAPPDPDWQKGIFDVIASLLCFALYPNVCYHLDKRRLLTSNGSLALIHRHSVNFPSQKLTSKATQHLAFKSPFFVFADKVKTNTQVTAKQMTMVTPLQLLLFGADKVESVPASGEHHDHLHLDDWVRLSMDRELVGQLLSLRVATEKMMVTYLSESTLTKSSAESIQLLVDLIYKLSDQDGFDVVYAKCCEEPPTLVDGQGGQKEPTAGPPPPAEDINNNNNNVVLPFWINTTPVGSTETATFKEPYQPSESPSSSYPNKKMALSTQDGNVVPSTSAQATPVNPETLFKLGRVQPSSSNSNFNSASDIRYANQNANPFKKPVSAATAHFKRPPADSRHAAFKPLVNSQNSNRPPPPTFNKLHSRNPVSSHKKNSSSNRGPPRGGGGGQPPSKRR